MSTRRSFIRNSSLLTAGLMFKPGFLDFNKKFIGLQLYTVREAMQSNPVSTLERVAKLGYNSLEGATYTGTENFYGMNAREFKQVLEKNGLIMPSSHYRLGLEKTNGQDVQGTILHGWEKAVDNAAEVGIKYMVCAYLSPDERGDLDHYRWIADELAKAGNTCKEAGIQLCYHNHDFEFQNIDGTTPYNVLLESDRELIKMELDIYWVKKAGKDPSALFSEHPGRFPLWHVKDMDKTPEKKFAEVGSGTIDFKTIFSQSNKAGLEYYFVEQDQTPGDPFVSIEKSIKYIKSNLV